MQVNFDNGGGVGDFGNRDYYGHGTQPLAAFGRHDRMKRVSANSGCIVE